MKMDGRIAVAVTIATMALLGSAIGASQDNIISTVDFCTPKKVIKDISKPVYIRPGPDGDVFIVGYEVNSVVYRFDKVGNLKHTFPVEGLALDVAIKNNELYVGIFSKNKVNKYSMDGRFLATVLTTHQPVSVAYDDCEDTFFVGEWTTGKIHVYDGEDFSLKRTISGIGKYPRKIFFDSEDHIRVPAFYEGAVYVYTKCGKFLNKFSFTGVTAAEGLFIDENDNMILAQRTSPGALHVLDKGGNNMLRIIAGRFVGVSDSYIGPDGTVWVNDYLGNTVYLF